jgi:rod shape-determining protein MreB
LFLVEKIMVLKRFRGLFANDLSIDLGTANTVIYTQGQGVVLNEPSVVAIRQDSKTGLKAVVAVGEEARQMLGRTPQGLSAVRPMKDGVIAEFTITERMFQYFLRRVHGRQLLRPSPQVLICAPSGSTQVERRAIKELALSAGAREVYLIDQLLAAALGAGLPVNEPCGSMVLDIGGGTSEVALFSLNGIVLSESIRIGGETFNEAIISYVRQNFGVFIGYSAAEHIKLSIGSAFPFSEEMALEVRGRHLNEGLPRSFRITRNQVLEALQDSLMGIAMIVKQALEQTPPELGGDVAERGIMLTGGGALLPGIDRLLAEETGLPIIIAEEPLTCVARGGGQVLEMQDQDAVGLLTRE